MRAILITSTVSLTILVLFLIGLRLSNDDNKELNKNKLEYKVESLQSDKDYKYKLIINDNKYVVSINNKLDSQNIGTSSQSKSVVGTSLLTSDEIYQTENIIHNSIFKSSTTNNTYYFLFLSSMLTNKTEIIKFLYFFEYYRNIKNINFIFDLMITNNNKIIPFLKLDNIDFRLDNLDPHLNRDSFYSYLQFKKILIKVDPIIIMFYQNSNMNILFVPSYSMDTLVNKRLESYLGGIIFDILNITNIKHYKITNKNIYIEYLKTYQNYITMDINKIVEEFIILFNKD